MNPFSFLITHVNKKSIVSHSTVQTDFKLEFLLFSHPKMLINKKQTKMLPSFLDQLMSTHNNCI